MNQPQAVDPSAAEARAGVISLANARTTEQNDDFLRATDQRLAEAARHLDHTWRVELGPELREAGGGPEPDILCDRDLPELLRALAVSGGKRIRPSMCFWGWVAAGGRAAGGDRADAVTAGWSRRPPRWSCCTSSL